MKACLTGEEDTAALGRRLAACLRPGDTVLLSGPVGAGKSVLARALIREAQAAAGQVPEDIPSPSFTLVQTYRAGAREIWHCDFYRLSDPSEIVELGVVEAQPEAILLIEWPGIARAELGARVLEIILEPDDGDADLRHLEIRATGGDWAHVEAPLAEAACG